MRNHKYENRTNSTKASSTESKSDVFCDGLKSEVAVLILHSGMCSASLSLSVLYCCLIVPDVAGESSGFVPHQVHPRFSLQSAYEGLSSLLFGFQVWIFAT